MCIRDRSSSHVLKSFSAFPPTAGPLFSPARSFPSGLRSCPARQAAREPMDLLPRCSCRWPPCRPRSSAAPRASPTSSSPGIAASSCARSASGSRYIIVLGTWHSSVVWCAVRREEQDSPNSNSDSKSQRDMKLAKCRKRRMGRARVRSLRELDVTLQHPMRWRSWF